MGNKIVLTSSFDMVRLKEAHVCRRWRRALEKQYGSSFDYLLKVLEDAKNKITVRLQGKRYRSCATFIKDFYTGITFEIKDISLTTCCRAYPKICGGICCKKKNFCRCNKISGGICCFSGGVHSRYEHINNCNNDCCKIIKIYYSELTWL